MEKKFFFFFPNRFFKREDVLLILLKGPIRSTPIVIIMANTKPPTRAVTSLSSWLLIFFYSFQKGKSVFTIVIITRQTHTHIHTHTRRDISNTIWKREKKAGGPLFREK